MGSYEIQWKSSAERDLRKIAPQQIARVVKAVDSLTSEGGLSQTMTVGDDLRRESWDCRLDVDVIGQWRSEFLLPFFS